MSTKNVKTVKQSRQDIRLDSVQDAIIEEASSIEDTEEEQVTPNVANDQGGGKPLQIVKESYDQQSLLIDQTETEKNRPKLKIGTMGNYKVFRPAFIIYKKEENGRRFMVEKIEGTVKQYLLGHWKMDSENFFLFTI